MEKTSRWFALIAAVCLIFISSGFAQAQASESEYFAQTGHYVSGDFLRFYRSSDNPIVVFGYPLTEQFTSKDGKTVQYFHHARFEVDASGIVKLAPLGRETYSPERQLVLNYPFACRPFPETGYSVCFAFLDFFDENGGVEHFGYPISPFEFRNNQIVQYFENARFEWRPDLPEGQRVGLTDLGRMYFDQIGEDPGFLKPMLPPNARPETVLSLKVSAFPKNAVAQSSAEQTIYVLVQDQNLRPIPSAEGVATIRMPNGEVYLQSFPVNDRGVGTFSFRYENQQNSRLVYIEIYVTYGNLQGSTETSFRIWY